MVITRTLRASLFALLACVSTEYAIAQDGGLSFLSIGTDAAALAMGDAGVASKNEAFSTYWNPAGLSEGGSNYLGISHHIWIGDVRTYAVSGRFSAGKTGGIGLYITATGSGDLEARDRPGEAAGFFDAQFVSASASYGRAFGALRAGITVKYLSERIFTNSANGLAFDFGTQLSLADDALRLGATLQNVGKMEALNSERTRLPRMVRLGVQVFPFRVLTSLDGATFLNTSVQVEVSRNTALDLTQVHVGLEAEVLETVAARIGYLSNDALRDFSAGLGVDLSPFSFDYAMLPFEDGFGGPAHIITLTYAY
jgi:hypothetical protein